jgi:hypothetical protein
MEELTEGEDFYLEGINLVFTQKFLLKRGFCCNNRCRNCPYEYPLMINNEKHTAVNGDLTNTAE